MRILLSGLTLVVALLIAVPAQASIIDTTGTWDGSNSVFNFGENDTGTYGQTFLVGADNSLDSFSFWLDDNVNPDAVDFAAYVMAWDGSKASGSVLYSSAMATTSNNGGADGMEMFTFSTGGLSLTSGDTYIAFMSASDFFDGDLGTAGAGYLGSDVYADGGFFFLNNGDDSSQWTTETWSTFVGGGVNDLAFVANFNSGGGGAVPEPTSALVWTAGIGMALFARRRKTSV